MDVQFTFFVLKSEFVFYNVGKKSASNCGEKMSLNNFMASPNSTTRKTQEIYSQREIYINQMGVVSSILRPFPLPDLAFSTPLLNLGSKIYEVFLRGRGVLCFIIWGILHSAILPQLRHRTKKKHLASQHWIWTTSFYSHMYKSDIFFIWKALRQAKKCSRVPVRQRAGGGQCQKDKALFKKGLSTLNH